MLSFKKRVRKTGVICEIQVDVPQKPKNKAKFYNFFRNARNFKTDIYATKLSKTNSSR